MGALQNQDRDAFETRGDRPIRGRGSISNRTGRFESQVRLDVHDGWHEAEEETSDPRTTVAIDASRSVIARNTSPDIPFDRSINPYRGCEHGCIYCFARPTHAYLGYSPGLDFETKLLAKPDAPALLEAELARPGYEPLPIAMGTNTDPYQPVEKRMGITRGILEVLEACGHPVTIVTKSALVVRDLDILERLARRNLVHVSLSVTTLDRRLARSMEPRASTPSRRLQAISKLASAGVPTSVLAAPMIPGLNDHEIEAILAAASKAGATGAGYILLRLPLEIADLFEEWLRETHTDRADRVLSLLRQTRNGRLYKAKFGERMSGTGPIADLISRRFTRACRKYRLARRDGNLDINQFRRPTPRGAQLALL
ncbi:MAG: PA0069 family radical SAM protein [Rhodospirillaceae bacterium]|nr:PA0069 family radical SAM protein [Rhodospirillaceae bacterium]